MKMEWIYIVIAVVAAVTGTVLVILERRRTRRIMKSLNNILDRAASHGVNEQNFDETLLSAIETKFTGFLSASAASSQNMAAEKDKIKTLIADISHQTKTPIANILMYAQLLDEQELPEDSRACVRSLHTQAEKLNFLIGSLVKLSRLETGILTLRPTEGLLQPMLDDVQGQLAPKAEEKGVTLTFVPSHEQAVFDPKWTGEAIGNLVDNAIKYTEKGGSVRVSVIPYELFCRIDVADTGAGIAEKELARVFARFYRSPAQSATEGVGIGLYLTRQILSEQRGYIKVASSLGAGTVFSVFLPRGT